ncbi:MAG: arsenate reductase (glutaredoxin) [Burkholderiales bacterium]
MSIKIYHNPRCGKSRGALAILEEKGLAYEVVEYLKTPPTKEDLRTIVKKLGIRPEALVRKSEDVYREKFLSKTMSDEQWLDAMAAHPILIERPIVVSGARAVIGRPPEKVLALF